MSINLLQLFQNYQHLLITIVMMVGFYIMISYNDLIKKLIGLGFMQSAVLIFFILGAQLDGASAPILQEGIAHYSNPLPHVLILTAIVVNVASLALGLALVIGINRVCGSLDEEVINRQEKG